MGLAGAIRPDFRYDIRNIKASEQAYLSRMAFVNIAIFPVCFAGVWLYSTWVFGIWALIYVATRTIWALTLWKLPDSLGRGAFWMVIALMLVMISVTLSPIIYSFSQPSTGLMIIGYIATMFVALSTIGVRTDDPILCFAYVLGVSICLIMVPVFQWQMGESFGRVMAHIALTMACIASFSGLVRHVRKSRQELRTVKEAELSRKNLESLGQLTGGVAHDFNNLLTVIIGNLELFRAMADVDEETRAELLTEAEDAADRAARLTSQLLVYARNSALTPVEVNLAETVNATAPLLKRLLPATHSLRIDCPEPPQMVKVDENTLQNVLVNLVVNARDAMSDGGTVMVSLSPEVCKGTDHFEEGVYVRLQVQDTGVGIPQEQLSKVLEPYFTTKPVGQGTGLGLSMALGFAEQSGGGLDLQSIEGEGTAVALRFPLLNPEVQALWDKKPRNRSDSGAPNNFSGLPSSSINP